MSENKKKAWQEFIKSLIDGQFLTEEFVRNQLKLLVLIVALVIVFISNSYSCMNKLGEIEDLSVQLKNIKYENLSLSTVVTSGSRQSQVQNQLERKGINLSSPKNPAYEIKK